MQEIKPHYVDFNTAKLLFEKGFPGATEDDAVYTIHDKTRVYPLKYIKEGLFYHAPEQHIVVEWLRVNHGIHIEILLAEDRPWKTFYYRVMKVGQYFTLSHHGIYSDTPQEAYSSAFDYVLKELI